MTPVGHSLIGMTIGVAALPWKPAWKTRLLFLGSFAVLARWALGTARRPVAACAEARKVENPVQPEATPDKGSTEDAD